MRIIVNCSNLISTGPVQVAVSFLNECKSHTENTYLVFLSPRMVECINIDEYPDSFYFKIIYNHPAYGFGGMYSVSLMKKYENSFKPDCVFSVFGPSIWKPTVPHLQGFAYGYYIYTDSPVYKLMPLREKVKRYIMKKAHIYHLKRDGAYFVCETEDVSMRLKDLLRIEPRNVFTVTNTYNHYFHLFKPSSKQLLPDRTLEEYRMLLLSTAYPHKNLGILNEIIAFFEEQNIGRNISFVVTISPQDYNKVFKENVRHKIFNVGPVKPEDCPQLYFETDSIFAPTLLECFSANYPEAMVMRKPIVTTDLSFARTICGDAALYFSPLDAKDAALKIVAVAEKNEIREELIKNGLQRLTLFDSASQRASKYLEICRQISGNTKNNIHNLL